MKDLNIYYEKSMLGGLSFYMGIGEAKYYSEYGVREIFGISLDDLKIFPEELLLKGVWLRLVIPDYDVQNPAWYLCHMTQEWLDNPKDPYEKISPEKLISLVIAQKLNPRTK